MRMSAALFRETSAQRSDRNGEEMIILKYLDRFCRESKEVWEKVQSEDTLDNVTRAFKQEG